MQIMEAFLIAVSSIITHKLRSSLTLLGVIIGMMTIISTMAVIQGLQDLMEEEMRSLSAGVFQVQRYDVNMGMGNHHRRRHFRPKLGMQEVRAIQRNVPLARVVAPEVWDWGNVVRFENEATPPNITMCGGTPGTAVNNSWEVAEGRFFNEQDVQFARPVAVIGAYLANRLFPYRSPLGNYITINGERAMVIGVFEERGSVFNSHSDYNVCVPITRFVHWNGNERSWNITVQARDPEKIEETIEQTTIAMRSARGLQPGEENNFAIWHSNQLVDSFNQMTIWIRVAAFGIASIALLVAGVGIMNIMLVTVTERTREIGIRKAIGATRRAIMWQFLVEAVILTQIGAVIGVGVGVASAYLLGTAAHLTISIPYDYIVLGLVFCSGIGLVFGTWPAWKAARLDPIIALRYE